MRLGLPVIVFLAWTPVAQAWSWPVPGPVLQPFAYDEAHPYAAGQHRGIDIGADAAGEQVVAPATGTVSFAGSVPTSGESVTIATADGYSVTLTHLGSILVAKGGSVAEGDAVGTIGPSGAPDFDQPYVHLGIRVASDPNGYVDPLGFLPPASASAPTQSDPPASQPSAGDGSASAAPAAAPTPTPSATEPASTSSPPATTRGATAQSHSSGAGGEERSSLKASAGREVGRRSSSQRPVHHPVRAGAQARPWVATPHRRAAARTSSPRRPVVEAAVPDMPSRLDAGHEPRPGVNRARLALPERERPSVLVPLACNGAAALVALAAAFAVARGRRRPRPGAQVLELPRPAIERRRAA